MKSHSGWTNKPGAGHTTPGTALTGATATIAPSAHKETRVRRIRASVANAIVPAAATTNAQLTATERPPPVVRVTARPSLGEQVASVARRDQGRQEPVAQQDRRLAPR